MNNFWTKLKDYALAAFVMLTIAIMALLILLFWVGIIALIWAGVRFLLQ